MNLTDWQRDWLQRRAKQAAPYEACGFVMDDGELIEIRNVAPHPSTQFMMDRAQMVEKLSGREESIAGIWHTHPGGTHHPSGTDLKAMSLGAILPHWDYWIVTAEACSYYDTSLYAPREDAFWSQFV